MSRPRVCRALTAPVRSRKPRTHDARGQRWLDDATHVAAATIARADAIVSWNFRHIVRLDRIKAYNQVNLANGYGILTIVSPRDVGYDEDAE